MRAGRYLESELSDIPRHPHPRLPGGRLKSRKYKKSAVGGKKSPATPVQKMITLFSMASIIKSKLIIFVIEAIASFSLEFFSKIIFPVDASIIIALLALFAKFKLLDVSVLSSFTSSLLLVPSFSVSDPVTANTLCIEIVVIANINIKVIIFFIYLSPIKNMSKSKKI